MVLRLLFVLLVALNLAVGAWLVLGRDDAHRLAIADPGVATLQLLSERGTAPASSVLPAASASAPAPQSTITNVPVAAAPAPGRRVCLTLGPFATEPEARNARRVLAGDTARSRQRQELSQQSRGWWVYLPALPTHAQALAEAQRLQAKKIADYFVVSTGDQPNTISLGVFNDLANARKRRDQVTAAGFAAAISERSESVPQYWLDVVLAADHGESWRQRVTKLDSGVHSTGCF